MFMVGVIEGVIRLKIGLHSTPLSDTMPLCLRLRVQEIR